MVFYTCPKGEKNLEGGLLSMSKNTKYSEEFGRLTYLSREDYFAGSWEYVASEDLDDDGGSWDIVRSPDNADWRYTLI